MEDEYIEIVGSQIERDGFPIDKNSMLIIDANNVLVNGFNLLEIIRTAWDFYKNGAQLSKAADFGNIVFRNPMSRWVRENPGTEWLAWNEAARLLSERSHRRLTDEEVREIMVNHITLNWKLINALQYIQAKTNCKLCLASHMAEDGGNLFEDLGMPMDMFDATFMTANARAKKNTQLFWLRMGKVFTREQIWPWNCILIDDKKKMVLPHELQGLVALFCIGELMTPYHDLVH